MTTVVFDGRTLATDSLLSDNDRRDIGDPRPKFYIRDRRLFVWCGAEVWHERLADHVLARSRKARPLYPIDDEVQSAVATWDGREWRKYLSECEGFERPTNRWAMGSGAPYALAALVMGAGAVDAVRVAAQLDINTGGPIFACDLQGIELSGTLEARKHEQRQAGSVSGSTRGYLDILAVSGRRDPLCVRKRRSADSRVP